MGIYEGFAAVYDRFMEETPYEEWCEQVCRLLARHGITGGLAAELGCGTGVMTRLLAAKGFDMIGIDVSEEMLSVARTHPSPGKEILYLCQDMREMELYGTVSAVIAVCDTMNYLADADDWQQALSLVDNYLDPGGLFVFDLRTGAYYLQLGEQTLTDSAEEGSYIWENYADAETCTNEYTLELYVREDIACGGRPDRYVRSLEEHATHWMPVEELRRRIAASGLELLEILDGETLEAPTEDSMRLYVVCREHVKKQRNCK